MFEIDSDYMDLKKICISGQCFRMFEIAENEFELIAGDRYLRLRQDGKRIIFYCDAKEFNEYWRHYFDWDRDYMSITALTDKEDLYLSEAVQSGYGIRILNQDLWEMLISFIISQQNNIKRIRRSINDISVKFGQPLKNGDGKTYYAFPTPGRLAAATPEQLRDCNLGYRAMYVKEAASGVSDGRIDLRAIAGMGYEESRNELLKIYGVGPKVADCICLFALGKTQAFPKDTHIKQALERNYPEGFTFEKYSPYQGIFQQFIFYKELHG